MGRRKLPFFERVTILDIGAEGKAIARINDIVTFVKFVAPGDIVDLQVTKKRSRYMEARVTNIYKLSETRETPVCKHFGICGGCKWQHLPYSEQLKYKQKQVSDALLRIGKLDVPMLHIIGSGESYFYRNKLEFAFSNKRWMTKEEIETGEGIDELNGVGFHLTGQFNRVVDIEKCWLQADPSNSIREEIKKYAKDNNLSFFNQRDHSGFLRNLIIRTSTTKEVMVILSFFYDDENLRKSILDHIKNIFPEITSLMFTVNTKGNDTLYDQEIELYAGKDHIIEVLGDLKFKIGPKSFFQTNTRQAFELYRTVKDFANLSGNEIVYDLYTGTGTIANFIAIEAKKVIGIDSVPEAITDAEINSKLNRITNTVFIAGDMKDLLNNTFFVKHGPPDVIITDPPRAGMHAKVVEAIMAANPERIVYVSCNPASQARDLMILSSKYETIKTQPFDMFPQTHHVENVVSMIRK